MEATAMKKIREIRYVKPSLVLKGRWGRAIIEEMNSTPKPDLTNLRKELDAERARVLALRTK